MHAISPSLTEYMRNSAHILCHCWVVSRVDGETFRMCDFDRDVVHGGETYGAGYAPAFDGDVTLSRGTDAGAMRFSGKGLPEDDISKGLFDGADMRCFMVAPLFPEYGRADVMRGIVVEAKLQDGRFAFGVAGMGARASLIHMARFSPLCRAALGDARCGVDLDALSVSGEVTEEGEDAYRAFVFSDAPENAAAFRCGKAKFTSGANAGAVFSVASVTENRVTLGESCPFPIAQGDAATLSPGCDKYFSTCMSRYDNAVNFRGEPHVPGVQALL
ncbi:MAG: DUF2163 domain-containing protein [Rickettsiales bacterium]